MADLQQLTLLRQGVKQWNSWREEHPEIHPDMSDAILSGAYLHGANLHGADLRNAILYEADLSSADLSNTHFQQADCSRANLDAAFLFEANLSNTILREAILTNATLDRAILHNAILSDANLSDARLNNANLGNTILANAILDRARLSDADLSGAHLDFASLISARLNRATLPKAVLTNANLSNAKLHRAYLRDSTLNHAVLIGADLSGADFSRADLRETQLMNAYLVETILHGANLSNANLNNAHLDRANLSRANFSQANLNKANLNGAILVGTDFTQAILNDCVIYGIAAWDVKLDDAKQLNLIITPYDQPIITVDNLKIAQFIYLLLNNREIRDVITTVTSKVVLLLGRFTPERKSILDALRNELRRHEYLPIVFDFEKPSSRSFTGTVRTLAHMARFILADITDPSSIPQELQAIVPHLKIPVQPILSETTQEYSMFIDFRDYPWVLPVYLYKNEESLLQSLQDVIAPAEKRAQDYEKQRQEEIFE